MRASTQHVRIVFGLFIAVDLAIASVKMPPTCPFSSSNRERKRNRRASLTKNGPQNWQRATKAHFISKRSEGLDIQKSENAAVAESASHSIRR